LYDAADALCLRHGSNLSTRYYKNKAIDGTAGFFLDIFLSPAKELEMIADDRTIDCLDLLAKDLCEAHAAERMLEALNRYNTITKLNGSEAGFGLEFIRGALEFRIALAVNRTLQGASNDKATFARLLRLFPVPQFGKRLDELRNGEAARRLRECRNGFMVHTLVGELGSRNGMKSNLIGDLLYELTDFYEDIHRDVTGTEGGAVNECLEKWRQRAWETWDALLGVADGDEDLDNGSA
jgi:hypothetical protein